MGTEDPAPSNTHPARPTPTNQLSPQELRALRDPEPVRQADWPDGHTTGAFISRAASFRYEVREYRWGQVLWSVLALYAVVVGLPVAAGVWAAIVIWHRL